MEIRHGRMSREEGIDMVRRYDANEPATLDGYCDFLDITKQHFYDLVEPMRDAQIWERKNGAWEAKDSVVRHVIGAREERARVEQSNDRTLAPQNRHLYYNPANPPRPTGQPALDQRPLRFKTL
jgi:hypothetical protein